ncbi:1-(5-phosphoribosyl)-5-[(5-phosphoribosylamino)methylideneamino]imidazole-4-carboxamide isomerase [Pullulanibacillus sp. KACC 23026]|uniref:1-(5-phosphoribosyl)-5-[(5- phosphoribosylamino)methylideneamino]imidazole-4- carboxamide isomerase n=1 Tax=Pullulanibacillus sp. KACC 23026 TaxID=3028315 RepID=UPI0023B1C5AC|nr:1-(5-phosphoribosyl)-5-[(5-phosphoribosylamino)methylideneamino]imidazole-4-carboxamide isomerase [Pullulanibacillus sp. KACC 23026]WEG13619.1 1-(5-phosphoribosyl)-5-[(5-phosphoribosylamino)methylideneamino]imidazole-4-carboxamide isomerase [Pullulanibacillus sp. KACC 23026]
MGFSILPAIDIRAGQCVRLVQGDFNQETVYGHSPYKVAESFIAQGAEWIHIVDLDGAKEGQPLNHDVISRIASNLGARIEVGGGIRNEEAIETYLEAGVSRVILGSAAVSRPEFVKEMIKKYGSKIAVGLDARDGRVAVEGWLETSDVKAIDLGKELADAGVGALIFTDISRDGMLSGPNVESIRELASATGVPVIASGGVSQLEDLIALKAHESEGIAGAIVGKAIYDGRLNLLEAIKAVKPSC